MSSLDHVYTANEGIITFDPPIEVQSGDARTLTGTFKKNGAWTLGPAVSTATNTTNTTTSGGTWTAASPWFTFDELEPDMTDWPPEDIIDWFAKDLAKRHPA